MWINKDWLKEKTDSQTHNSVCFIKKIFIQLKFEQKMKSHMRHAEIIKFSPIPL